MLKLVLNISFPFLTDNNRKGDIKESSTFFVFSNSAGFEHNGIVVKPIDVEQ